MEKINYHEQELDWIDGLLAITDAARRILLALKRSQQEEPKPTCQQKRMMGLLGVRYTSHITQQDAEKMIDCRCQSILESMVERGHRPDKGRPFFFSGDDDLLNGSGKMILRPEVIQDNRMQKTAYYVTEGTPFSGWVGPVEGTGLDG
jgi:hypothetical protein